MKTLKKLFISFIVCLTISNTFIPFVHHTSVYADQTITNQKQIKELEQEMNFIFNRATKVRNGKIIVNERLLAQKYGMQQAKYISEGIKILLDAERIKEWDIEFQYKKYSRDWLGCMGNALVDFLGVNLIADAFGGGLAGIQALLAKKAFGEIAKIIVGATVKTSVPVMLATLVWFSGGCLC